MKRTPFCKECKYYLCNGICNHPKFGGEYSHVNKDFWCCYGEKKEKTNNPPDLSQRPDGQEEPQNNHEPGPSPLYQGGPSMTRRKTHD